MAATKQEIREWFIKAKYAQATHMLVVCDTWKYEDYPVMVFPPLTVDDVYRLYDCVNMQKVMEVYFLDDDMEKQLAR